MLIVPVFISFDHIQNKLYCDDSNSSMNPDELSSLSSSSSYSFSGSEILLSTFSSSTSEISYSSSWFESSSSTIKLSWYY